MVCVFVVALVTDCEVITGDGPLPMAIFELLEYIVNEVTSPPPPAGRINIKKLRNTQFEF